MITFLKYQMCEYLYILYEIIGMHIKWLDIQTGHVRFLHLCGRIEVLCGLLIYSISFASILL